MSNPLDPLNINAIHDGIAQLANALVDQTNANTKALAQQITILPKLDFTLDLQKTISDIIGTFSKFAQTELDSCVSKALSSLCAEIQKMSASTASLLNYPEIEPIEIPDDFVVQLDIFKENVQKKHSPRDNLNLIITIISLLISLVSLIQSSLPNKQEIYQTELMEKQLEILQSIAGELSDDSPDE